MNNTIKFILALLIPLAIGGLSGYITAASVEGWFSTIHKPSFNPPNQVFAPVWTTLYALMGIGLFLVWKQPQKTFYRTTAITFFIVQLVLNFFWSILFFYLHHPAFAFIDIVLMWISILGMIIFFYKVKPLAGLLQIPYICWVSFATVLNYSIWQLNK